MGEQTFNCGHPRYGENRMEWNAGRSARCRQCHATINRMRAGAGRGALLLVLRLMREGVLSEGQVCKVTGLDRIEARRLADEQVSA